MQQRSPGVWRLRVYTGRDPVTGQKRQRSKEFRGSERQAETELAAFVTRLNAGQDNDSDATLSTLLLAFCEHSERIGRSPTTLHEYRRMARGLETGAIASCPIRKLSAKHLDELYSHLSTHGLGTAKARGPLSPASVNRYHDMIKAALRQAVRWGWLDANPADHATPPTERRRKVPPPTPVELRAMIARAAAKDRAQGVLLAMAATTGGRRGELCALRWSDLDLDAGLLHIRRALRQVGQTVTEGPTKTHQERSLALPAELVRLLTGYRRLVEEEVTEGGFELARDPYLFSPAADYGRPYKPSTITSNVGRVVESLGYSFHLHQLRHFAATQLISNGTDVATVSKRLGHSNTSVTLDVYTHVIADRDRAAAGILGSVVTMPELTRSES